MSIDLTKIDLDVLKATTAAAIAEGVEELVVGAKEDVRKFGIAITTDLLEAKLTGRDDLVDRLLNQVKMVGELNRLRSVNATWAAVAKVVKAVLSAVLGAALAMAL